ncbi:hypothetical protein [Psychrobacter glaciei]|uniref:capsular polysaccharide export protein, LipB/KpsS family n=1 Tax=Psychrobacter glaciei TaxID=619771 RepID=UPI001F06AE87|nr:hypothetical protein [Psychrobacter glaciei]MCH1782993.1 hypothetical protein [Psychrobacter glaciei]
MFKKQSRNDEQVQLAEYFSKRTNDHWKKKIPKGKEHFYTVHDPYEIFGEGSGYEQFYLVGDNWTEATDKPIAIAIGFNDWKFGFIADYLPEFRVAFSSRKLNNYKLIFPMMALSVKPSCAVVWGYNESKMVRRYLKLFKIEVWRAEDGFIRSADLGASGATPYSLVFDKSGLYYNPNQPSDIENILNNSSFVENESLKEQAKSVLDTVIDLRISKYNPPVIYHDTSLKLKKRILVVGQVDNDASIRYGNTNGWTMEDMVRLAKYEHPDAEILYRPHPEIYKGFQESKFKNTNVEYFAKILSPDEHIIDLIERVDHIYTITSLTGLEALLRGKKVTVLGKPFYAGWGLTDDRSEFEEGKRLRKLSLLELFIGAYIIYPRYIIDLKDRTGEDNVYAIKSTLYKISSDSLGLSYKTELKKVNSLDDDSLQPLTPAWVQHELRNLEKVNKQGLKNIFTFFRQYEIDAFLLSYLWGSVNRESKIDLLYSIQNLCDQNVFINFLYKVQDEIDRTILKEIISNFFPHNSKIRIEEIEEFFLDFSKEVENRDSNEVPLIDDKTVKSKEVILKSKLNLLVARSAYDESLDILQDLIRMPSNDSIKVNYLNMGSKTYYNKFEFQRSTGLCLLSMMIDIDKNNRKALTQYIDNRYILDHYQIKDIITEILLSIKMNPELISKYRTMVGRSDAWFEVISSSIYLNTDRSISRLMGLIEHGDYRASKKLFHELYSSGVSKPDKLLKVYTDFLHSEGDDIEAIKILESFLKFNSSEFIIKQLIRLNLFTGNFTKAETYIRYCINIGMKLNSTFEMPILQHQGKIGEAYSCYINENFTTDVSFLLKDKFRKADSIFDINAENDSLILAVYGPGDEIRFVSIYKDIEKYYSPKAFTISCDYRLYNLLCRSFKDVDFLPIRRTRGFNENYPMNDYNKLPSTTLTAILDNSAFEKIEDYNRVFLVTDFVGKFRDTYSDFTGDKYLYADTELVEKYSKKLKHFRMSNKKLVGLNWRSSLTNFTRMEHYVHIEQLAPIFRNDLIQFVNLQYDDCDEELKWVEDNFPGKMINFSDIDQYNDLDSVAALMCSLDLVIAPATTVAELAGALGVNTWLFSNSSEIDWRKVDSNATDVWHNSMTIVDIPNKGDKTLLVNELAIRLHDFVCSDE